MTPDGATHPQTVLQTARKDANPPVADNAGDAFAEATTGAVREMLAHGTDDWPSLAEMAAKHGLPAPSPAPDALLAALAGMTRCGTVDRVFDRGIRALILAGDLSGAEELHHRACVRLGREYAGAVCTGDEEWLAKCRARSAALLRLGQELARARAKAAARAAGR